MQKYPKTSPSPSLLPPHLDDTPTRPADDDRLSDKLRGGIKEEVDADKEEEEEAEMVLAWKEYRLEAASVAAAEVVFVVLAVLVRVGDMSSLDEVTARLRPLELPDRELEVLEAVSHCPTLIIILGDMPGNFFLPAI